MKLPDWVLPFKEPKTEIKYINGSYYKYAVSYKYNPQKKRTDKITGALLGKITPEGFVKSAKYTLKEQASSPPMVDIKMYGTLWLFRQANTSYMQDCYIPEGWLTANFIV
ncbi:MAG: hypothetical protein N2110_10540, partial [Flavobacteriales bacterium]|nr:hypothetical protein [Flavobacteriales bacterium]